MKYRYFSRNALRISVLVFLLLSSILVWLSVFQTNQIRHRDLMDIDNRFLDFQNRLESFIFLHANILHGFSAFIQAFDDYTDTEVSTYLRHLLSDTSEYIRNIEIIRDASVIWTYPPEHNTSASGKDLFGIKDQSRTVLRVKNERAKAFEGPVDLVQGGTGYIIRIPLLKEKVYWGMARMVIKAKSFIEFMDSITAEAMLDVLIQDENTEDPVMYGDISILDREPHSMDLRNDFGSWTLYYVSREGGTSDGSTNLLLFLIAGGILVLALTYIAYSNVRNMDEIRNRNAALSEKASTDRLTGLYNRSMLESFIAGEIDRADRYQYPLSMLMFDLDHFKMINDTYGHDTGDRVLAEIARTSRDNIRKSDFFARWGGEEFILVMPRTHMGDSARVAEKLRSVLAALDHEAAGQVTVSIGMAQRLKNEYWGGWFRRVDKALYKAKKDGRNRIAISLEIENLDSARKKIEWNDIWLSGNPIVDEQHQKLVVCGNKMIESVNISRDSFFGLFDELVEHLQEHFKTEETELKKVQYPFLEEHHEIHNHLLSGAIRTRKNLRTEELNPEMVFDYIIDEIIVGHLIKDDFRFFSYMSVKRNK
ncbi:MAG: diguanylate cyclase [Spirochaetales bacterium]|nr:diguanylate cyclase [Spirochaetales bacterium]